MDWRRLAEVPKPLFDAAMELAKERGQIKRGNAGLWRCINALADAVEQELAK